MVIVPATRWIPTSRLTRGWLHRGRFRASPLRSECLKAEWIERRWPSSRLLVGQFIAMGWVHMKYPRGLRRSLGRDMWSWRIVEGYSNPVRHHKPAWIGLVVSLYVSTLIWVCRLLREVTALFLESGDDSHSSSTMADDGDLDLGCGAMYDDLSTAWCARLISQPRWWAGLVRIAGRHDDALLSILGYPPRRHDRLRSGVDGMVMHVANLWKKKI